MLIDTTNIKSHEIETNLQDIINIANKCYTKYSFYPISFSNYQNSELLLDKTKVIATVNPKDISTYIFNDEETYSTDYKKSLFGITMVKAGWDCNRHLEIMRNSCLPLFENIQMCPEYTMIHYPKQLFLEIMLKQERIVKDNGLYTEYLTKIIKHYNTFLTNSAMINYIFSVLNKSIENQKILFIDSKCPGFADYQSVFTLNGLKQIFKNNCEVLYPIDYVYTDTTIDTLKLYGKGFAYSKLLNPEWKTNNELNKNEQDSIINNIKNKYYDYIFYGSIFRSSEHLDIVLDNYKKEQIITICGEDIGVSQMLFCNRIKNYTTLFVREIFNLTKVIYPILSNNSSYINEHLITLSKYSETINSVIALTNNKLDGFWGIVNGMMENDIDNKKITICGEMDNNKLVDFKLEMSNNGIQVVFKDDYFNDNTIADILFIDHIHVGELLTNQLNHFQGNIKKYIIIHGTEQDEIFSEAYRLSTQTALVNKYGLNKFLINKGLGFGIMDFLFNNKGWKIKQQFTNNNGLLILEKIN